MKETQAQIDGLRAQYREGFISMSDCIDQSIELLEHKKKNSLFTTKGAKPSRS